MASVLSMVTYAQRKSVLRGLTTSIDVQNAAAVIFPAVIATQVLKGLAYSTNGIVMGGLDWLFTMLSMWAANFVCIGMVRGFSMLSGSPTTLGQIWWALAAFMGTQVVTSLLRLKSKTGVWKILRYENEVA